MVDVRVIQGAGGPRLALEALQRHRVRGQAFGQELQGDEPAQLGVVGLVNHTHPAAAELLQEAVMRNSLAEHHRGHGNGELGSFYTNNERSNRGNQAA
ncbi:MAG TPA: hypothetical protein VI455_17970 [Terriglobia bacterium]